jgi:hypothetical protein
MKLTQTLLFALTLVIVLAGCKKDDPTSSSDQYTNKLTLGMGMSGFTITTEATVFYAVAGRATVYWRLESAADMAGSSVTMKIERQAAGVFVTDTSITYTNPQSYGHIMLSSFTLPRTGSFRATGLLATGTVTVASQTFTIQ